MNTELIKRAAFILGVWGLLFSSGIVATGAVQTGLSDTLFEDDAPNVSMVPHDGPNGKYVVETADQQLAVNFSGPDLTRNAAFQFDRVFDLVNEDDQTVIVWVTHENDDILRLYDDWTGKTIAGEANAVELAPGERVTVSIDVDTTGTDVPDRLLSTVTLHATYDPELPEFSVELDGDEEITADERGSVTATITNTGGGTGNTTVEFLVNDEVNSTRTISLEPGESTEETFFFGSADVGETTLSVHAGEATAERTVTVVPSEDDEADTGGGGSGGGAAPVDPGTPAEPTEPTQPGEESPEEDPEEVPDAAPDTEDVEVEFESSEEGDSETSEEGDSETDVSQTTVRELDPNDLDELEGDQVDRPTQAIITDSTETSRPAAPEGDDESDGEADAGATPDAGGLESDAYDTITIVNEPTELSGERSTVGVAEGVNSRDRIVKLVDIEAPGRENSPATVRMRVDRERFGDGDLSEATIGHETENGWELLETRVAEETENEIVLEARTPSFSMFAAFADTNVQYEWTLPDGTVLEGRQIDPTFDEPGFYDVQLTVTDAFGRQSTATHRVLANDVPEASVEVVSREGDQATLAANVTNELGETEVTWRFPDGTTYTGEEVTHTLEEGEHEIGLRVEDEYGAASEGDVTVAIGPPGASASVVAESLGVDLEMLVGVGLFSTLGTAVAVGYRRVPWGAFSPRRRRGPEIVALESVIVEAGRGRITVGTLIVNAPERNLEKIIIEVTDADGQITARKQLDVAGRSEYRATPETLVVPPGCDVDPKGEYAVAVEAVDAGGRSTGSYVDATHVEN